MTDKQSQLPSQLSKYAGAVLAGFFGVLAVLFLLQWFDRTTLPKTQEAKAGERKIPITPA